MVSTDIIAKSVPNRYSDTKIFPNAPLQLSSLTTHFLCPATAASLFALFASLFTTFPIMSVRLS